MDVIDQDRKVLTAIALAFGTVVLHENRPVASTEEVAPEVIPGMDPPAERRLKPPHPLHEIRFRSPHRHVVMIVEQHSGEDLPSRPPACFPQRVHEELPILVRIDDRFTAVSTPLPVPALR